MPPPALPRRRSPWSRFALAAAIALAGAGIVVYRFLPLFRAPPSDSPGRSPVEAAGTTSLAADPFDVYFVVVEEAPIRDAVTREPVGKLERGTWLRLRPDRKSFTCYDPWEKPVNFTPGAAAPGPAARQFFTERLKSQLNAEDLADRAAIDLARGEVLQALSDLDRAIGFDPNLFRAVQRRSECRRRLSAAARDPQSARRLAAEGLKDADHAIELRPDDPLAYDTRSQLRQITGDSDGALADLKKALELRPDHALLHNNRAKYLIDLGRDDEALSDLNRAIELSPEYADAYTNRGILYARRRQFEPAIADAGQAIKLNPKSPSAWVNRGNLYLETRDYDKAVADFDELVRLAPDRPDGYLGRANANFLRGSRIDDEAASGQASPAGKTPPSDKPVPTADRKSAPWFAKTIEDCDAALKLNPRDYQAFNTKANALKKLDKPQEAIAVFDAVLAEMEKESREAKLTVADDAGVRVDAWDQVEKAINFPDHPAAFDRRTHELALRHPHRAVLAAIFGNRADAHRMLGQGGDKDEIAKALADLTRAIIFDPRNPDYYRVRGFVNLELKRYPEAMSDLAQALELRPEYPEALRGRIQAEIALNKLSDAWTDVGKLEKLGQKLDEPTLTRLRQASGLK